MNKFTILLFLIVFTQQVTVEEDYGKLFYFFKSLPRELIANATMFLSPK